MDAKNSKMYINEVGTKIWKNSNGHWHRLEGPAIIWANGTKYWYKEDKPHRLNGPARECVNGYKYWWINSIEFSEEEFNSWIKQIQRCV